MKDFSLEDAMNGFSKLRNNALGEALEYMKEVEAWGGGVSRYFTACSASGLPPPTISEEAGFFKVVFWRKLKESKGIFEGGVPLVENNMPCSGTLKGTLSTLKGTLNPTDERVLMYIAERPGCQASAIIADLSIPRDTLNKVMKRLVAGGLAERRGSKKTGGYYVKT